MSAAYSKAIDAAMVFVMLIALTVAINSTIYQLIGIADTIVSVLEAEAPPQLIEAEADPPILVRSNICITVYPGVSGLANNFGSEVVMSKHSSTSMDIE
jgi:hypothetical protein